MDEKIATFSFGRWEGRKFFNTQKGRVLCENKIN